jgi:hypothetical protein
MLRLYGTQKLIYHVDRSQIPDLKPVYLSPQPHTISLIHFNIILRSTFRYLKCLFPLGVATKFCMHASRSLTSKKTAMKAFMKYKVKGKRGKVVPVLN